MSISDAANTATDPRGPTSDVAIVAALAGNPNAGKTTMFNSLTGARQHVGNYPGVTVERKEGEVRLDDQLFHIVDLPGTYSLTPYSLEEVIARDFVIRERPDVVVDVVDASNLERNLYLATQFIELGAPLVIALNMVDVAEAQGLRIDHALLSQLLGVPIVPVVATTGFGKDELLKTVKEVAQQQTKPQVTIPLGSELDPHIEALADAIEESDVSQEMGIPSRWLAIKLLENDAEVTKELRTILPDAEKLLAEAAETRQHVEEVIGDDPEMAIGDRRWGFIAGACRRAVTQVGPPKVDITDVIDDVVTHRIIGIPLFILMMYLMFEMVFTLGEPPIHWIELGFDRLAVILNGMMADTWIRSLIVDGIIGGVGGVLVFVPNILLLFLAIAFIEDSGYMARVAFVVDRVMQYVGLHGKSFIPMLIGFGCTVPAMMAARTIDDRKNRLTTILIAPLMSCSARLPVYLLLTGAFFAPHVAGKVIFSLYLLGVLLAVIVAFILRKVVLPGDTTPFVMELPPYRMPTIRGLAIHTWERTWHYVKKAGTVILAASVIVWFLSTYPAPPDHVLTASDGAEVSAVEYTYAGRVAKTFEPLIRPLGFDYKVGIALIAGFAAKEAVVSTLGTVYKVGEPDEEIDEHDPGLRGALRADPNFSPLVAYTLMVFVLIYVPCIAVIAVVRKETNSWKWPLFLIAYTCSLAWIVSFIVYQGGRLLGF